MLGSGSTPTNWNALPIGPRSREVVPVSQPPGSEKTTTSHARCAELLYDDAVVDLQRVLHRDRRDQEHLTHKSAEQGGNNDGTNDDGGQFFEKGEQVLTKAEMV